MTNGIRMRYGGMLRRGRRLCGSVAALAVATVVVAVPLVAGLPIAAQAASCPQPPTNGDGVGAVGWGSNGSGQVGTAPVGTNVLSPTPVSGLTDNIAQVDAGREHSVALTRGGQVWAWGRNNDGQLGDGTFTNRASPVPVSGLGCVTQVAAMDRSSLALKADGTVWSWGSNDHGDLGTGARNGHSATPVQVPGLTGITQIGEGVRHVLALRQDGTVWGWGDNNAGQLGDGTASTLFTPMQIAGITSATEVAAGNEASYALAADGTVESWGANESGALGIGSSDESVFRLVPGPVPGLSGVTELSTYDETVLVLESDGTVRVWGDNSVGQIGDGTTTDRTAPVLVPGVSGIVQVAAGAAASYALRTDHTVLAWGDNRFGQMGNGAASTTPRPPSPVPGLVNVRSVSAGALHVLALTASSAVAAPGAFGSTVAVARDQDGRLEMFRVDPAMEVWHRAQTSAGSSSWGAWQGFFDGGAIRAVAAETNADGRVELFAVAPDGSVWHRWQTAANSGSWSAWVQVGGALASVAVARNADGRLEIFGSNSAGQVSHRWQSTPGSTSFSSWVALDGSMSQVAAEANGDGRLELFGVNAAGAVFHRSQVTAGTNSWSAWSQLDGSLDTIAAARNADGRLEIFGSNSSDQVFHRAQTSPGASSWSASSQLDGSARQVAAETNTDGRVELIGMDGVDFMFHWRQTTPGGGVSDPVQFDSPVLSWGDNTHGQLAKGSLGFQHTPGPAFGAADPAVQVASGSEHNLAVRPDGVVWAAGSNEFGQLGDGTTTPTVTSVRVAGLGGVTQIATSSDHNLALRSNHTVWAWGRNASGQLGDGTTTNRSRAVQVAGLSDVVEIATGFDHSLARRSDGTVWAWGSNIAGELGDGTTTNRLTPVQVPGLSNITHIAAGGGLGGNGGGDSLALRSDGTVWAWGNNTNGQVGDGTTTSRSTPVQVVGLSGVTGIGAGTNHDLAVVSAGAGRPGGLFAWGDNARGQLGDGTTTEHHTPVAVALPSGMVITQVDGGFLHTAALASDGTVWTWGFNSAGQLGDGMSGTERPTPAQVPGLTHVRHIAAGFQDTLVVRDVT